MHKMTPKQNQSAVSRILDVFSIPNEEKVLNNIHTVIIKTLAEPIFIGCWDNFFTFFHPQDIDKNILMEKAHDEIYQDIIDGNSSIGMFKTIGDLINFILDSSETISTN